MKIIITLAVLLLAMAQQPIPQTPEETRKANNAELARYTKSGGFAYWHNPQRGYDPDGTEVMVRRCNRPELRVSTKPIFDMKGVTKLILHGVDFTDADLKGISNMKDLPALLLSGKISDDGMKHLQDLSSLKKLWIYQTQVNGTGLKHLKNLDQLECLYIDTKLSQDGFEQLKQLKHVKQFSIPSLSEYRIEALRQALPNAKLVD